jgi:hypothetical protein
MPYVENLSPDSLVDQRSTTIDPKTEQSYRVRASQLVLAAGHKAGGRAQSPAGLASYLLGRRAGLAAPSWRQYRAALVFTMNEAAVRCPEGAADFASAIAMLQNATPVKPDQQPTLRTSQQKQKNVNDCVFERVVHGILATSSPNAETLVDHQVATVISAVRSSEWPTAEFNRCAVDRFAWELTIVNGKNSNGRAHGHIRTLRWTWLADEHVARITAWIATAKKAESEGGYDTLLDTLEALMRRVTKRLFHPRRKKFPKLSSARHMAAARWKHQYVASAQNEEEKLHGLAIVAALMGHANDETATRHYARASKGTFPIPTADPSEVARIRRVYAMPFRPGKEHKPAL